MSPDNAIRRILELSAETQMKRREAAEDSPAFHNLTGAIAAYGKALDLLLKFPQVQESYEGLKKIIDRPANVIPIKPEIL
jgi:hypothetical protein